MNDLPIACSLDADWLADRLGAVGRLGDDWLLSSNRSGSGWELAFQRDEDARERLEDFVAAESKCCGFLKLALREDGEQLVRTVGAPSGAEAAADEIVSAFGARREGS